MKELQKQLDSMNKIVLSSYDQDSFMFSIITLNLQGYLLEIDNMVNLMTNHDAQLVQYRFRRFVQLIASGHLIPVAQAYTILHYDMTSDSRIDVRPVSPEDLLKMVVIIQSKYPIFDLGFFTYRLNGR